MIMPPPYLVKGISLWLNGEMASRLGPVRLAHSGKALQLLTVLYAAIDENTGVLFKLINNSNNNDNNNKKCRSSRSIRSTV